MKKAGGNGMYLSHFFGLNLVDVSRPDCPGTKPFNNVEVGLQWGKQLGGMVNPIPSSVYILPTPWACLLCSQVEGIIWS